MIVESSTDEVSTTALPFAKRMLATVHLNSAI